MKLCCFFNHCPFYRFPIYSAIDKEFDAEFYFNDCIEFGSKPFDVNQLKGFKSFVHGYFTKLKKGYVVNTNISPLFNWKYTHYILTGDPSFLANWLILIYGVLFRKKVFLWCHGINAPIKKKSWRFLMSCFYGMAEGILLYGEHAIPYMKDLGCKEERMFCIHNSLDTELQTRLYNTELKSNIYKEHFGNDNPIVIYIGRIQKRKKVDQLVKAIYLLHNEGINVNLVIVGNIMDDDSIQKCVSDYNLEEQVWFYGPSYTEETNSLLLYNSDVCVSPGNVGLTCIHALSYGTPVISNDNFETQMPEYAAIVPDKTGDFYKENDIADMAKVLKKWIRIDIDKRTNCRIIARNTVLKNWSVQYQINLLKSVLFK